MRSFLGADTDPRSKEKQKALELSQHVYKINPSRVSRRRQTNGKRARRPQILAQTVDSD